jgi:hypothetical protein
MKSIKVFIIALVALLFSALAMATEPVATGGVFVLSDLLALLPANVSAFITKAFTWVSGIVTVATAIVALTPSTTDDGILAKIRSIISVLSGNVLNNK